MDIKEIFVTLTGILAIIWIIWFFFLPKKSGKTESHMHH